MGAAGALGAPGAFGAPGAPGALGAPGAAGAWPGVETANPHSSHCVAEIGFSCPHMGQETVLAFAVAGLKHMSFSSFRFLLAPRLRDGAVVAQQPLVGPPSTNLGGSKTCETAPAFVGAALSFVDVTSAYRAREQRIIKPVQALRQGGRNAWTTGWRPTLEPEGTR